MLEARGLVKLVRLSGEDLVLSSWWVSLDEKIDIFVIMELVEYMATDIKR